MIDLSNNNLTGEIPAGISDLKELRELNLSNNNLTGDIPEWIGLLQNLKFLYLDDNQFDAGEVEKIQQMIHNR